ncbi:nuclear transport factor 2 family protein [Methylocystis sp. ATCC 49242]|uniref:nuclear transport factor 2 family protein n=1 Tax=Methylocystis sp. ATCC 49242 TaxID=622637 RepID=UPI0001F8786C|nr:nuclear transport factor 2 family protein [Methylocystis sp. ATCC 49242]
MNSCISDPVAFARQWAENWNARNVEAVLAHCHDDVIFTSPIAATIDPSGGGVVRGKAALRDYWSAALAKNPHLSFTVTSVFAGVDCLLIGFRTQKGEDRIEVLRFRDGLVFEGHGTFGVSSGARPV